MKTVKLQILSSIIILSFLSCQEIKEKVNLNKNNLCKVEQYNLIDTSLFKILKEDIENYKYNINTLFKKEHFFFLYPNPNDTTLFYMSAGENFVCSPNIIGVFFIDSITIGISSKFRKNYFEFKDTIELKGMVIKTPIVKSTVPYTYNPLIWEYKILPHYVERVIEIEY